ncbi:MAG: 4-hydroxy-3-methylbut-2-enyl diphosphate reductase [Alphaproteobacteria bacterium RIFCSPHIGHO2_12_FULL_63_12]|nr:MAG: 4-hydroxy-3-methylbut-2-enyl diphosphate reductase [Alphaproteobacteria bacterium RIFCSPHIGHO2_12_FULL_63_12]
MGSAREAKAPSAVLVRLAAPRGFCAGVERAVRTVEEALAAFGPPVFVRHEIVHNAHVVNRLKAMGAVFIEDLASVAPGRPVIFSAHGAPRAAYDDANARALMAIDATCPLVLKVHNEVRRHVAQGRHVVLIGHRGHPETIGIIGQAAVGTVTLIETVADAETIAPPAALLAYATQTTLSVDDAAAIIAALKRRFPAIEGPRRSDICYATQNRQEAVKLIAPGADVVFVVGSPQSSNSLRLVETAHAAGAGAALLVDDPSNFDLSIFDGAKIIGVTSGASVPEDLVEALLMRLAERTAIRIETVEHAREETVFKQPLPMAS